MNVGIHGGRVLVILFCLAFWVAVFTAMVSVMK